MDSDYKAIVSALAEVKRNLDPAFSYVILEKKPGLSEGKDFSEALQALSRLWKRRLGWQIYRDEVRGVDFLVVKMKPDQDELIMEKIVDSGLPQCFTCSFYRSHKNI